MKRSFSACAGIFIFALFTAALPVSAGAPKEMYLSFPGGSTTTNHLDNLAIPTPTHSGNLSYEAWVYFDTIVKDARVFVRAPIFVLTSSTGQLWGRFGGGGTSGAGFVTTNPVVTAGKWQHIAVTHAWDGTNTTLRIYVDGNQVYSQVAAGISSETTTLLRVGYGGFKGSMDEIRFWNKALTQAEIQANMNSELPSGTSGLFGYWQCNTQSTTSVEDNSGGGSNIPIIGTVAYLTQATSTPVTSAADEMSIGPLKLTENTSKGGWDVQMGELGAVNFQFVSFAGNSYLQATIPIPDLVAEEGGVLNLKGKVGEFLTSAFANAFEEPTEIRMQLRPGISMSSPADATGMFKNGTALSVSLRVVLPFGLRLDPTRAHLRFYAATEFNIMSFPPTTGPAHMTITGGLDEGEVWSKFFGFIPGEVTTLNLGIGGYPTMTPPVIDYALIDAAMKLPALGGARFYLSLAVTDLKLSTIDFSFDTDACKAFTNLMVPGSFVKAAIAKFADSKYSKFLPPSVRSVLEKADNGVVITNLGARLSLWDLLKPTTPSLNAGINVKLDGIINKDYNYVLPQLDYQEERDKIATQMGNTVAAEVEKAVKIAITEMIDVSGMVSKVAVSAASDVSAVSTKMGNGAASFATNYAGRVGQIASKAVNKIAKFGRKKKNKDDWDNDYAAWNLRCAQASEVALAEYKAVIDSSVADYVALFELSPKTRTEREAAIATSWAALQTQVTAGINNLYLTTDAELTAKMPNTRHKKASKYAALRASQSDLYGSALTGLMAYMVTQKEVVVSATVSGAAGAESYGAEKDTVSGTVAFTGDNTAELYVNGEYIGNATQWEVAKVFTVSFVDGENIVALKGVDLDALGAMLCEVTVQGVTYRSNSDWLVSTQSGMVGWEAADFDTTTGWIKSREIASWGSGAWGTKTTGHSRSSLTKWIWSASDNDQTVYFRKIFNISIP